ncbi:nucleoside hydrolase [Granulicella sibirica]|uniref:Inosine-uridine preferring nucleoside hydrolase n=1 Tax=Granulicella sibirica TaxID=2479048 RepID=A0A4Q0SV35_9BACT|nr:nucleoside hydrolase [Granulicella sibirica]RXH54617.1 Inosine-uridine preferring nucleoside hydrolase [Granulicella sibirica]
MKPTAPRRPVLIDTDTASDDAVALIMALRSPAVEVVAITIVAGNVPVEQGARNALYTAELCGSDVPVYVGASKPIVRDLESAEWFHGLDGLGDHGYAPARRTPETMHAVDAIIAAAHQHPGLEVITLGPLTNLALALHRDPSIVSRISRCVVMGGAPCCEGNVTPAAEFNIWVDPEAARMVFASGLPIEMIGWQLSRDEAVLSADDIARILAIGTPLASFAIQSNSVAAGAYEEQTGEPGISLPDPIAMAVLLEPGLSLSASSHAVQIETISPLTRGMTVVDKLNVSGDQRNASVWAASGRAEICWKLDVPGWKAALERSLR